jgi:hypothetical protein
LSIEKQANWSMGMTNPRNSGSMQPRETKQGNKDRLARDSFNIEYGEVIITWTMTRGEDDAIGTRGKIH